LMMPELLRVSRSSTRRHNGHLLRLGLRYCLRYIPAILFLPTFAVFALKVLVPTRVKRILLPILPEVKTRNAWGG